MSKPRRFYRLTSAGDSITIGGDGSHAELSKLIVGAGGANAAVTVYGSTASSSASQLASIDASATRYIDFDSAISPNGFFINVRAGNAYVTVVAG